MSYDIFGHKPISGEENLNIKGFKFGSIYIRFYTELFILKDEYNGYDPALLSFFMNNDVTLKSSIIFICFRSHVLKVFNVVNDNFF